MRTSHAIVIALLAISATADADRTSVSATASGDVSATDNVFAAPRDSNEGDVSLTVRPGVLFRYNAVRTIHELELAAELIELVLHSDQPSASLRGAWRGAFRIGKDAALDTQISGSNGRLTALSARSSPDQTPVQVNPIGAVDTQQGDASEVFSWSATRNLQLSQTLFGRVGRTDDNLMDPTITKTVEAGLSLGIERTFRNHALSLEAGAAVLRLELDAPAGAAQGSRLERLIEPRVRVQWRHDFDRNWSNTLDGGVVFVQPYGTDPDNPTAKPANGLFPIAGGALAYSDVWVRAQLQVRRDVAPNLLIAQNTVSNSATLSIAMPLPWLDDSRRRAPKLVALGSIGADRTRLVASDTGKLAGSFDVARLDIGLGYSPRPGFTYGVRYELVYQTGDSVAVMLIPGFYRNTLAFTFAIQYPSQTTQSVPRRRSGSVRADGKDLVPLGVDPVSIDKASEQSGDGSGDGGGDSGSDDE